MNQPGEAMAIPVARRCRFRWRAWAVAALGLATACADSQPALSRAESGAATSVSCSTALRGLLQNGLEGVGLGMTLAEFQRLWPNSRQGDFGYSGSTSERYFVDRPA